MSSSGSDDDDDDDDSWEAKSLYCGVGSAPAANRTVSKCGRLGKTFRKQAGRVGASATSRARLVSNSMWQNVTSRCGPYGGRTDRAPSQRWRTPGGAAGGGAEVRLGSCFRLRRSASPSGHYQCYHPARSTTTTPTPTTLVLLLLLQAPKR
jgi:hypothetical protein